VAGHYSGSFRARQEHVHEAIQAVGGYWRPISGVARLLEELGELGEQLEIGASEANFAHLTGELADVWIISTCIANQYNIQLDVDLPSAVITGKSSADFFALVSAAGNIARIVNYYDGPKTPRDLDKLPTLGPAIAALHVTLYRLAARYGVDLEKAIEEKVAAITKIDIGRFQKSYDPSTAESLVRFKEVQTSTACPFAREARMWGGPRWEARRSLSGNVESIIPYLISFTKVAARERLDGFVLAIDDPRLTTDMCALSQWFRRFLKAISARDKRPNSCFAGDIERPGWQFSFNDLRLFISVFSPLYSKQHSRHASSATFVVLQPKNSFDRYAIGSLFPKSNTTKKEVRRRFREAGVSYLEDVIDSGIEAAVCLMPRWHGDICAAWWKMS